MKEKKKNQNIQQLWNSFKECSICVIGIPEEKGANTAEKKNSGENYPQLNADTKPPIQEA